MKRNKPKKPRVFCIGWHKTGTTSLGIALLELGYSILGARLDMAKPLLKGDISTPLEEASKYDALQDLPWAPMFKELDLYFPGSKFILTVRDEHQWLKSASKHFKEMYISLHEWVYGVGKLVGNEEKYIKRFRSHYIEVEQYFMDRTDDLLVMNLSTGDGWQKLCSFLEEPIPGKKFPYVNKGKHNYNTRDRVIAKLRMLVPMPLRKFRISLLNLLGLHKGRNRFNNQSENRKYRKSMELHKFKNRIHE